MKSEIELSIQFVQMERQKMMRVAKKTQYLRVAVERTSARRHRLTTKPVMCASHAC
jgi:hypothetical protein